VFDVLVVALGLFLNHQIIGIHHDAIRVNEVWEQRLDRYLDLGTVAGEVNAPGNDVFDSGDVAAESARQRAALRHFEVLTVMIRADLTHVAPRYARTLRADLDRVQARMGEMVTEANRIFSYFDRGRADLAGRRMAAMDRRYHDLNAAITRTRESVGGIQRELFARQDEHAQTLRRLEYLSAGFVVLMICCALVYGHRIRSEMEARDTEAAAHVRALERSTAELSAANAALTGEVTRRAAAEARLRLSEERYALAARAASDGLWDWDQHRGEVYYSPRWKGLLGFGEDELTTRPGEWFDRVHPDDLPELHLQLQAAGEDGRTFEVEHRVRHRDGGYRWMLARGQATTGEDGGLRLVGSHSDVTARKEAELNLVHDSLHDALTGLPNRVLFLERLERALRRARRSGSAAFAVLYVDLDRFMQVNDGLGHAAGDALLDQFAAVLLCTAGPEDTVARLGGDEFAVLVEDCRTDDEATDLGRGILCELQRPFVIDGVDVHASASIGVVIGQASHASTTEVLRHADAALYRAKRDGRGQLQVFEAGRFERVFDDVRLEMDLRGAVDREELHLLYQPIVDLDTTEVAGYEALARWTHPDLGLVSPATFIPIAEESGDIVEIGDWVLEEACLRFAGLRDVGTGGEPLFVSVNVSTRQLLSPDFATRVQTTLQACGLSPGRLRLEITESSLVRDRVQATAQLQRLRDIGVMICVDDFGTGHSALSYVQDLPVDCIKIDRSFVTRITTSSTGLHIVRAIVDLAHGTGMYVVAEGIDTEDKRTALRRLGCRYGQGYAFDEPLPFSALGPAPGDRGRRAS
jgi:diguanylate cyclase (GGDEF)-like protein/PAS domain S-box-containing protein